MRCINFIYAEHMLDFLSLGIILPLLGVPALKISTLLELFFTPSELEPRTSQLFYQCLGKANKTRVTSEKVTIGQGLIRKYCFNHKTACKWTVSPKCF